jgi:hypothetical protein
MEIIKTIYVLFTFSFSIFTFNYLKVIKTIYVLFTFLHFSLLTISHYSLPSVFPVFISRVFHSIFKRSTICMVDLRIVNNEATIKYAVENNKERDRTHNSKIYVVHPTSRYVHQVGYQFILLFIIWRVTSGSHSHLSLSQPLRAYMNL